MAREGYFMIPWHWFVAGYICGTLTGCFLVWLETRNMNAETDAYYGRPDPSRTYKWGLVLPVLSEAHVYPWRVVCWFPTRKNAEAYAKRVHGRSPHAIARASL